MSGQGEPCGGGYVTYYYVTCTIYVCGVGILGVVFLGWPSSLESVKQMILLCALSGMTWCSSSSSLYGMAYRGTCSSSSSIMDTKQWQLLTVAANYYFFYSTVGLSVAG